MVHTCAFTYCKEKFRKGGASFYSFPKDKELRKKWFVAVGQNNIHPCERAKLCSKHFTDDCFEIAPWSHMKMLKPNSVPTIFMLDKQRELNGSESFQNGATNDTRPPDVICVVKYCRNKVQSRCDSVLNFTSFFHFPKMESVRSKWLYNCGLENSDINLDTAVICDVHFRPEDFLEELTTTPLALTTQRKLCPRAVPSRFLRTENTLLAQATTVHTAAQQFKESLQDKLSGLILKEQNSSDHSSNDKAVDKIGKKLLSVSNALSLVERNAECADSVPAYHNKDICIEYIKNALGASKPHRVRDIMHPAKVPKICFICDEPIMLQTVPLRHGLTHFSSTALPTKLGQLMGEGFMVVVADSDVLCTPCFDLLNCLDKIELELDVVRKVLRGFLKGKYHLNEVCNGLTLESSLKMLNDQLDETTEPMSTSKKCRFDILEQEIVELVPGNRNATSAAQQPEILSKKNKELASEEVQAKRVKFCDTLFSDDEHVDWDEGDMQGHIIVVHDYSN